MAEHVIEMWSCDAHLALVCQIILSITKRKIATVRIPKDIISMPEKDVVHCDFCNAPARFLVEAEGPPLPLEQRKLV